MKKILFKISKRGTKHTQTCFSKRTHHASLRLGERASVYWAEESAKITGLPNQRARNKALLADSAQQPPGRADAVSVLFLPPFPFLPESPRQLPFLQNRATSCRIPPRARAKSFLFQRTALPRMDQRKAIFRAKLRETKEKQQRRIDPSLVRFRSDSLS